VRALGYAVLEEGSTPSYLGADRNGRENVRAEIPLKPIPELSSIEVAKFARSPEVTDSITLLGLTCDISPLHSLTS
jgi:hypothetical protein